VLEAPDGKLVKLRLPGLPADQTFTFTHTEDAAGRPGPGRGRLQERGRSEAWRRGRQFEAMAHDAAVRAVAAEREATGEAVALRRTLTAREREHLEAVATGSVPLERGGSLEGEVFAVLRDQEQRRGVGTFDPAAAAARLLRDDADLTARTISRGEVWQNGEKLGATIEQIAATDDGLVDLLWFVEGISADATEGDVPQEGRQLLSLISTLKEQYEKAAGDEGRRRNILVMFRQHLAGEGVGTALGGLVAGAGARLREKADEAHRERVAERTREEQTFHRLLSDGYRVVDPSALRVRLAEQNEQGPGNQGGGDPRQGNRGQGQGQNGEQGQGPGESGQGNQGQGQGSGESGQGNQGQEQGQHQGQGPGESGQGNQDQEQSQHQGQDGQGEQGDGGQAEREQPDDRREDGDSDEDLQELVDSIPDYKPETKRKRGKRGGKGRSSNSSGIQGTGASGGGPGGTPATRGAASKAAKDAADQLKKLAGEHSQRRKPRQGVDHEELAKRIVTGEPLEPALRQPVQGERLPRIIISPDFSGSTLPWSGTADHFAQALSASPDVEVEVVNNFNGEWDTTGETGRLGEGRARMARKLEESDALLYLGDDHGLGECKALADMGHTIIVFDNRYEVDEGRVRVARVVPGLRGGKLVHVTGVRPERPETWARAVELAGQHI